MAIKTDECAPFLSGVVFYCEKSDAQYVKSLRKQVEKCLRTEVGSTRNTSDKMRTFHTVTPDVNTRENFVTSVLHYAETKRPAWFLGAGIRDKLNQIVVISAIDKLIAITFSDAAARNSVVREIKQSSKGAFSKLKILSNSDAQKALVENEVRTLWLKGTHRQSVIKPDSKQLSGLELEYAMDPLDDQSYYFSSVRSTLDNTSLAIEGKNAVVGTSPGHSRFWVSPTRDWDEFSDRMKSILIHIAEKLSGDKAVQKPLDMLAQPINSLAGVQAPYGVSLIVPDAQVAEDNNDGDERWFQQFADAVTFNLTTKDAAPSFEADVFWGDEKLGRLSYEFEEKNGIDIGLKIQSIEWSKESERDIALRKLCMQSSNTKVYFDTGHTFSSGHIYETKFRDPKFDRWSWVKMAIDETDFGKEKPNKDDSKAFDAAKIGNDDDKSLFGLVARNWPNLKDRGSATGWLICDDGAMESADFIHIDDEANPPKISLIHVKGSGNKKENRKISVSDYEVVIGQAVKNVRYLDQGNLHDKLKSNTDRRLSNAVWHKGKRQQDRTGILNVLDNIGSNHTKEIVVLQPRVRKSVWKNTLDQIKNGKVNSPDVLRLKQLDALLQGAAADCFAVNAQFTVIADDDT